MNFKPSDFFMTLYDFLSAVLPGGLLCYVLTTQFGDRVFGPSKMFPEPGNTEKWVIFLFASYLIGHLLFAAGSRLDDLYDKTRMIRKKRDEKYDLSYLSGRFIREQFLRNLFEQVMSDPFTARRFRERKYWELFDTELLKLSEKSRKAGDDKTADALDMLAKADIPTRQRAFTEYHEIVNAYKFTKAVMLIHAPAAFTELIHMEATQKFFRTLFVVFVAIAVLFGLRFSIPLMDNSAVLKIDYGVAILTCGLLAWFCFYRYGDVRFKSTELAYNLLIVFERVKATQASKDAG